MKRKTIFSLIAVLLISLCAVSVSSLPAYAEESEHTVEYSDSGIVLPILRLPEGQSYRVEVFAFSDEEYSSPLKTEGFAFYPETLGSYRIRYTVHDNGRESFVYSTLKVEDTTEPVISVRVAEKYNVGDTVNLRPSVTDNTAHLATVTYTVLCNGARVDVPENGVLTVKVAGEYRGRVSVTDAGGNVSRQSFEFTAEGGETEEGCGCGSDAAGFTAAGGILCVGFAAGLLSVKRRKNKEAK